MRRLAFTAMLLISTAAIAGDTQPTGWIQCATDLDCAVVQGVCGPAAVNVGIADQAVAFFKGRAAETRCVKNFWDIPMSRAAARCRLERCEIVSKE